MATEKRRQAAKRKIRKAQSSRKSTSRSQGARSQPERRRRQKPGNTGEGNYYHIEVRPGDEFTTFRTQDVGDPGHVQRVAGRRASGSWSTAKWLISKEDAHMENGRLVGDTRDARDLLKQLGSAPSHLTGDRFEAKDRHNVPENAKPTPAQTRARKQNIKKAQAARRKRS